MMQKLPLLVICGPTASGKSSLALRRARECGGEIVSLDSMQLYADLPIGTAQPTREEQREIPHHLVGVFPLDYRASVTGVVKLAKEAIADIHRRGKVAIVCGGTGLYIQTLLYGMDDIPSSRELRQELDRRYDHEEGVPALRERLKREDPELLEKWSGCRRRLIRGLEVKLLTGRSILEWQSAPRTPCYPQAEVIKIQLEAAELKKKIAERALLMLRDGWISEAESALKRGLLTSPTAWQAIGYRQIGEYLAGKLDFDTLYNLICTATWQYARRQRTWFAHH